VVCLNECDLEASKKDQFQSRDIVPLQEEDLVGVFTAEPPCKE
jgi:hypothetical protein